MAKVKPCTPKCMKRGWLSRDCLHCGAIWQYSEDACWHYPQALFYHIKNPFPQRVEKKKVEKRVPKEVITVLSKSDVRHFLIAGSVPLVVRKGEMWYLGRTNRGTPLYLELGEYVELGKEDQPLPVL